MRVNTPLNFIQPSGGNVLHAHHAEFKPSESSPALPSGSVWYEGLSGDAEQLAYQGASGIFKARSTHSIGYYENTTLQEMNPGPYIIEWDQALIDDEGLTFLSADSTEISLGVSGLYRLYSHIHFINNSAGAADITLQTQFLASGIPIVPTVMAAYIPTVADGGECSISCHYMDIFDVGTRISVEVDFILGAISSVDVERSYLEIEFINKRIGGRILS